MTIARTLDPSSAETFGTSAARALQLMVNCAVAGTNTVFAPRTGHPPEDAEPRRRRRRTTRASKTPEYICPKWKNRVLPSSLQHLRFGRSRDERNQLRSAESGQTEMRRVEIVLLDGAQEFCTGKRPQLHS